MVQTAVFSNRRTASEKQVVPVERVEEPVGNGHYTGVDSRELFRPTTTLSSHSTEQAHCDYTMGGRDKDVFFAIVLRLQARFVDVEQFSQNFLDENEWRQKK